MELSEIRANIDKVDKELQDAFIRRMELSDSIADLKIENGDVIYKPEREAEIIEKLSKDVDGSIKAEYIAFVRKIIGTSRMYQYKKYMDVKCNGDIEEFKKLVKVSNDVTIEHNHNIITIYFKRNNNTLSIEDVLSVISDYGIDVIRVEECYTVTLVGSLYQKNVQTLCYQLMNETADFSIIGSR